MDIKQLSNQWTLLLQRSQILLPDNTQINADLADAQFKQILKAYQEPQRHYHTLVHIEYMLNLLNDAGVVSPVAYWATWYHDVVYRPGRRNNEADSARLAEKSLNQLGLDCSAIQAVADIIDATQHHQAMPSDSDDLKVVMDADLAILGEDPSQYCHYTAAVRKEFNMIPFFIYRTKRKAFLNAMLSQEKIFHTACFVDRFEEQARENIAMEILDLS